MTQFPLYLNLHLKTGWEVQKLILVSVTCALLAIPTVSVIIGIAEVSGHSPLELYPLTVAIELVTLCIFFAPSTAIAVGAVYALNRDNQKLLERVAYGFIAGFSVGFLVLLVVFKFDTGFSAFAGIAAVGFGTGVFLSFLKRKPEFRMTQLN